VIKAIAVLYFTMDQHQLAQGESAVGKTTTLDDESRHQLALKTIQKARLPQAMPEGFSPLLCQLYRSSTLWNSSTT
jgi:hypothetical protein